MITFAKPRLEELIELLCQEGYEVLGPRVEQGAIVYGPVASVRDLPVGWHDVQEPGSYRLVPGDADTYFGFAVGPHSWKRYLFPPRTTLWNATRTDAGIEFVASSEGVPRRAFLGVRPCELHAIAVQDRVFLDREGKYTDPHYVEARTNIFLIAVECQHPAATCFCTTMGTGPGIDESGKFATFDIALTELDDVFLAQAGTEAGAMILERLGSDSASEKTKEEAKERVAQTARGMPKRLDEDQLPHLLADSLEHPHWDDVATRCLSCTNCTLVCPTCFCSSVKEHTALDGQTAERVREWDSCFDPEFAYVHGGNFRDSIRGRYRQWLTHKFGTWVEQFGTSGCVGCGRCVTWCPVGIDVTRELQALATAGSGDET